MCVVYPPWYECVVSSRVQRVDVTVGIIKGPVPKVLGQLKRHLPLCQCDLFTMPYVHFTTEIKHYHLTRKREPRKTNIDDIYYILFTFILMTNWLP